MTGVAYLGEVPPIRASCSAAPRERLTLGVEKWKQAVPLKRNRLPAIESSSLLRGIAGTGVGVLPRAVATQRKLHRQILIFFSFALSPNLERRRKSFNYWLAFSSRAEPIPVGNRERVRKVLNLLAQS